ncbi:tetratricopeptide repeat protein [Herpetosiphon llansteffanensis]
MSTEAFQAGVAALKSGNKALARQHLMQVVEQDENNEQAWLYLAGALDDPQEMRISLENALHINPQSSRAKQGLDWLRKQHPAMFVEPTPAIPEAAPVSPAAPAPAYTGATLALADMPLSSNAIPDQPSAPGPAPMIQPAIVAQPNPVAFGQVAPPTLGEVPDILPCPRCGAQTRYSEQRCRQCSMNLTIKAERQNQSKAPLMVAGVLTILPAIGWLISALGLFLLVATGWSALKTEMVAGIPEDRRAAFLEANQEQIDMIFDSVVMPILNVGAGWLLVGVIGIVVSIALFKRTKFGYFGTVIYNFLFLAAWSYLAIFLLANSPMLDATFEAINQSAAAPSARMPIDIRRLVMVAKLAIQSVYFTVGYHFIVIVLLIFAWRSLSQKAVRFVPQFEELADGNGHFNRGVVYQKRGMWYLSMLEWERAVKLNPRDSTYRHALGLIYEQMKRPADALQQFEQALTEDPNNLRISQDRDRLVQTLRA